LKLRTRHSGVFVNKPDGIGRVPRKGSNSTSAAQRPKKTGKAALRAGGSVRVKAKVQTNQVQRKGKPAKAAPTLGGASTSGPLRMRANLSN
jgi:hypothetical protein